MAPACRSGGDAPTLALGERGAGGPLLLGERIHAERGRGHEAARDLAAGGDPDRLGGRVVLPALRARLQGLTGLPGDGDEPAGAVDRRAPLAGAGGATFE